MLRRQDAGCFPEIIMYITCHVVIQENKFCFDRCLKRVLQQRWPDVHLYWFLSRIYFVYWHQLNKLSATFDWHPDKQCNSKKTSPFPSRACLCNSMSAKVHIHFTALTKLQLGGNRIESIEGLSRVQMAHIKDVGLGTYTDNIADNNITSVGVMRKAAWSSLELLSISREWIIQ